MTESKSKNGTAADVFITGSASLFIIYLLFLFTDTGPYILFGSHVSVYVTLIMGVWAIVISNVIKIITESKNDKQTLFAILSFLAPFILTIGSMIAILYLMVSNYNAITQKRVSPSYKSFSTIAIFLFFIQIYLIYYHGDKPATYNLLYIFGLLTSICGIILYTILSYFSTDG
jgi:hypothetical protein